MTPPITLIRSCLVAAGGVCAFGCPTAVLAGPITTYTIDEERSYVSAYVPDEWLNGGDDGYGNVSWNRGWKRVDFGLSGSFSLETTPSEFDPTRSRLYLTEQAIVTDAPEYAHFTLPYFFAKQNEDVSYSDNGCFDDGFFGLIQSCSFLSAMGHFRTDQGTLKDGILSVEGEVAAGMWVFVPNAFTQLPAGVEPDPDLLLDYGAAAGNFRYHLVAVGDAARVPEPGTISLMLGGLAWMRITAQRRKATPA